MGCLFRFTFLYSFVSVLASGFFLSLVSLFRISLFTDPFILVFNYIIRGLCFFMIIIPGIQALAAVLAELLVILIFFPAKIAIHKYLLLIQEFFIVLKGCHQATLLSLLLNRYSYRHLSRLRFPAPSSSCILPLP